MKKIYIWGAGYYLQQVIEEIDDTKAYIAGILDNDKRKQGKKLLQTIPIISPSDILNKDFDYVVISVKEYKSIETICERMGIHNEKIVAYWNGGYKEFIFKKHTQRIEELMEEKKQLQFYLDSMPYELGVKYVPEIQKGSVLLQKIMKDHSSLCRFGDGEFEIIRGNERPWFQMPDIELGKRLKEVFISENKRINIAIPQNFVGLEQYKKDAADNIRSYMFGDTRKYILDLVNRKRVYYDTYVTRPYIIYKERTNADIIFHLFKEIWKCRNVLIIEGEYSRIGIGNDLLECAKSVLRIVCPSKNAWNKYDSILNTILQKVSKESLICISLGPCATVLAYDLFREGYQALDIGQLDNEYDWYLSGTEKRTKIPGKMVAEIMEEQQFEIKDEKRYKEQIIAKII